MRSLSINELKKGVCSVALPLLMALPSCSTAQWSVVNLNPPGSYYSDLRSVSSGGQLGNRSNSSAAGATLWNGTASSWILLTPPGAQTSTGYGIDGDRQVGEVRFSFTDRRAALWRGTAESHVDLHPAGASRSTAYALSSTQQVGETRFGTGQVYASLWSGTAESWINLNPTGASQSWAYGVNDGVQVGYASTNSLSHAGIWRGSSQSWVDIHPAGGYVSSAAFGVCGDQQVGQVSGFGRIEASLWTGTAESWISLNPFGALHSSAAATDGINQVGWASFSPTGAGHAGIWSGTPNSWVDLGALLPSGYVYSEATGIWRDETSTYVVGYALNDSTTFLEAVMWVAPVPEPATMAALGLGAVAVIGRRRK